MIEIIEMIPISLSLPKSKFKFILVYGSGCII
jgi:hypothetical protein